MTIEKRAKEAWEYYERFKQLGRVVEPSIPVLYFGNYPKYRNSQLKIVTVGLNPSSQEFPENGSFLRFRGGETLLMPSSEDKIDRYLHILNSYFDPKSYYKWFDSNEKVLAGFQSSYFDGLSKNTVLHTDLLSPLATNPAWDKLEKIYPDAASKLSFDGILLWERLIVDLKPDIVLISVANSYFSRIRFSQLKVWSPCLTFQDKKQSTVFTSNAQIQGTDFLLVKGRTVNIPFGTLTDVEKKTIGPNVLKLLEEK